MKRAIHSWDRWLWPLLTLCAFVWLWKAPMRAQSVGYGILNPRFSATDNNGLPCSGCLLSTYVAGTSTPATTYSDSGLTVPNTNPIVLDSAGRASVYIPAGTEYKLVLQTASSVTLYTQDNVSVPSTQAPPAPAAVPTGTVFSFTGSAAPSGYLLCDGSAVSRTTYAALFAVEGTTYGSGDGSTTFNLPNMVGRFAFGKASSGTGSTLGGTFGTIDHTHTGAPHTHTFTTNSAGAHTHTVPTDGWGALTNAPSVSGRLDTGDGAATHVQATTAVTTSSSGAHTHTGTTDAATFTGQTGTANPPGLVFVFVVKT